MKYKFPQIENIADFLVAISGKDEFIVKSDPVSGIQIINYLFATATTFPDPTTLSDPTESYHASLLRECRGITFDLETGQLISRKYQKFHNVNQTNETQANVINWSRPHILLDKLDGSMITPMLRKDDDIVWHTKMGATGVAELVNNFVGRTTIDYDRFAYNVITKGFTPIFEFCSHQQKIVLDYPTDMLILTAIRNNFTGEYVPYPKMVEHANRFGIPYVKALDSKVDNIQDFLKQASDIRDAEGYVIRFDDGHMCKVKSDWYCAIHRTHDMLNLEKDVWHLMFNDLLDDAKPHMQENILNAVEGFEEAMREGIKNTANHLINVVQNSKLQVGDDKKRFALEVAPQLPPIERALVFGIWDGKNAFEVVKDKLRKSTGSQTKVDEARQLVGGVKWADFYLARESDGD